VSAETFLGRVAMLIKAVRAREERRLRLICGHCRAPVGEAVTEDLSALLAMTEADLKAWVKADEETKPQDLRKPEPEGPHFIAFVEVDE
jgi:hypothetical protein